LGTRLAPFVLGSFRSRVMMAPRNGVLLASLNMVVGILGMVTGFFLAALAALSVHEERDSIPGWALMLASALLALAGLLWLMSWSVRNSNVISVTAAAVQGMAIAAGAVATVLSGAMIFLGIPPSDVEGVVPWSVGDMFWYVLPPLTVMVIIPGAVFLLAAFELRYFWLHGI